ncbi:Uncharacterized protein SCF082_LOCUS34491, partial [Durusdinium trenchii]
WSLTIAALCIQSMTIQSLPLSFSLRPTSTTHSLCEGKTLCKGLTIHREQRPSTLASAAGSQRWSLCSMFVSWAVSRHRSRARRRAAAATDFDIDIIQKKKTGKKTEEEEETKTSKDMWVVLVHAPIRNCKMPWCKIPGLRRVICTCLKDGVEPGAGIRSKDGKCALTLEQYAEVLSEGVPLLSRGKAYEVSSRLFESAMANPVGTAVVINSFKKAAEDYHQRLTNLGLWTSIAPVDRD